MFVLEKGETRPSFFTKRETCEVLGLSKAEVNTLVSAGKLTPLSVTGRDRQFVVYDFNEVSELIIPTLNRSWLENIKSETLAGSE
jgi:hypothetical protein